VDLLFRLPERVAQTLEGFGGPLASWFLYRPARALLDAGEGLAPRLVQRVAVPEVVFLTHAHYDHVSGLIGLLLARTMTGGGGDRPLTLCYPAADEPGFRELREQVERSVREPAFPIRWRGLAAGERVKTRHLVAEGFPTLHNVPSLGYRFLEGRRRLKDAYRGLSPQEIRELKEKGVAIHEAFEHVVLAFTGDTGPGLDPELFRDADVLVHEATFLEPSERVGLTHTTVEEALTLAAAAGVKTLILYHVSPRYRRPEIERAVEEGRRRTGFAGELAVVAGFTHADAFYS
jgi:ribonuclease Z